MSDTLISELEARLAKASVPDADPVGRIDALNALAWELRGSDIARGNALAREARELSRDLGYALGQARATRTMGMTIGSTENLRGVLDLAEEAKRLFDEAGDAEGRAASRDFLSSIYEHIGDLAGGLALALDALSIARELGDPIRQGYALSSVGGILAASGEVDTAVEHLEEALQIFEEAGDLTGVGTIASRLSKILRGAGKLREALVYAERCREAAEVTGSDLSRWAALGLMAELAAEAGELEEAERLYRDSLESWTTGMGRDVVGTQGQVALGRLLIRRGALAEAEHELTDALRRIDGQPMAVVTLADLHDALADLKERQGELAPAIEHLRESRALREQISKRDAHNRVAQIEVRASMEAAKSEAAIQRLRFVELHGMQAKLVEAEKTALLGKLAAGMAHELNTPLGVLRSNTDLAATASSRILSMLKDAGQDGAPVAKLASVLESCRDANAEAMERITAMTQSFARFAQLDEAELRSFDVTEGLDIAVSLLEPSISAEIELERRFEPVPPIEGWPRELNHAFMTVLQNAAQAIEGAGVVTAETSATEREVVVRVRDTGRGMTEEQAANLFDVAWSEDGTRTKMRLGLSAAHSTTEKHGGTMEVQSVLGEGTVVTFRFPIVRPSSP